jgi:hypothetical protein
MTTQEMRIACAELCGAVWYRHPVGRSDNRVYRFIAFPAIQELEQSPEWMVRADGTERLCSIDYMAREFYIPDYPNDLNAMHEAEGTLFASGKTDMLNTNYWNMLWEVCGDKYRKLTTIGHATAPQRCEAFLRVHKKWIDEP